MKTQIPRMTIAYLLKMTNGKRRLLVKKPQAIRGEASGLPRPFNTLLEAAAAADDLDMS
jgi:hypothetical protein